MKRSDRSVAVARRVGRKVAASIGCEQGWNHLMAGIDPMQRRTTRDAVATRAILCSVLTADSCAVDVGANVGDVLAQIVRIAPEGHHVAFEPVPRLASDLKRRFSSVEIHAAAVAERTGRATFFVYEDVEAFSGLAPSSLLPDRKPVEITVPIVTLDATLEGHPAPELIKIDVEGAEADVLVGASQTLARARPVVLFEHGQRGPDESTSAAVFDALENVDMRIFDLEGDGPYTRSEFEVMFTGPLWDFVATPKHPSHDGR